MSSYVVSSGEVLSGQILFSKDLMTVQNGGVAEDTTVNDSAKLTVNSKGKADGVIVSQGAQVQVSSGGTAVAIKEEGGIVSWNSGAVVSFVPSVFANSTFNGGAATIHSGTTATDTLLKNGADLYVYNGGLVTETTVSKSIIQVSSGGSALNTILNDNGQIKVFSKGTAENITVSQGAQVQVSSGGTAVAIKEEGGFVSWDSGAVVSFVPSLFTAYTFNGGAATIHSGTTATEALLQNGADLYVYNGGLVAETEVNKSIIQVSSGGSALNTILNDNGQIKVFSKGAAENIIVSQGAHVQVSSGGTAVAIKEEGGIVSWENGAVVSFVPSLFTGYTFNGGSATIHSGTTATETLLQNGADLYVYNGGLVTETEVNKSIIFVSSGGTALNTVLNDNGQIRIALEGTAENIIVSQGAQVQVSSGGTAVAIKEEGGIVSWDSGAVVSFVPSLFTGYTFNGGSATIHSGTTATETLLKNGADLYVYNGGLVTDTEVNKSIIHVSSGGRALNTVLNSGGQIWATFGGTAEDVLVSSGATIQVSSGGAVADVLVSSGATIKILLGGKLTGQMTFESGATVSSLKGGIVDFDLTTVNAGETAIMNDFSLVTGVPIFTLTVDGTQENGIYNLADGVSEFTGTISVMNTAGEELGTISLDIGTQTIDNVDYTLTLTDNTLAVEVVSGVTPTPDWTFFIGDFNGDDADMLSVQSGNEVTVYMNGESWGLGLTLDPGWNIAGVGDFNGDLVDDFLRVSEEGYVVGEMSNGNGTFSPQVLNFLNEGWSILGIGDFDSTGYDDVLIANPTAASDTVGLIGYWEGGTTWVLINGYSAEWDMIATGDFNADGNCDMLWRNSFIGDDDKVYNAYCTWLVGLPEEFGPGGPTQDWFIVSVANPDEWNFLCAGDFNGDSANDIAMINTEGVVGIWGVEEGMLSSWSILSAVNTSEWSLVGVGDFNADGTDDIAWANTATGLTGYWQINDKELTTWANLAVIG